MDGDAIDRMGDTTATADDRATRKRDLLDGPAEFDRVRIDRPKRGKSIQNNLSNEKPPTRATSKTNEDKR
ncbi:hypothetical protein [Bradyrhizobium neotropicale]|uniref:Uncharacterized protein n=1 Tax=Bradyrhizobium neotropicale TaxID=1497615 RepID=A0A176YGC9_9BRAD|nr:hypothetical protein [Bradyrhizobium neotropicale]OAF05367.1 hypothetical protein AXW67_33220 [Bradyrhizobium neotropicale]